MNSLDIEDVEDAGEMYEDLGEDYLDIQEEIDVEPTIEIMDYQTTLNEIGKKKATIPYLSKYERVKLIGTRDQQLKLGAKPTVKVGNLRDTRDIAIKELNERKIPLIIRRYLPDKSYEDWRISELSFERL